jgi:hypothetical protein
VRIHLYANCWNEIRLLPYFIRHYEPLVERFFILDDGSSDGSIAFLQAQPKVRLICANRKGGSYIERSRDFFNEAWKASRSDADWIIACNIDEHLHHPDLAGYFRRCRRDGVTVLPARGYEMVSVRFPSSRGLLRDEVRWGAPASVLAGHSALLNKPMAFDPQAIEDMRFTDGRHQAHPVGQVVYPESVDLQMLHYKFLGLPYAIRRYAELRSGLSSEDIRQQKGHQYLWGTKTIIEHYAKVIDAASVIVPAGPKADAQLALTFLPLKPLPWVFKIERLARSFARRFKSQ